MRFGCILAALICVVWGHNSQGASLFAETFDLDAAGWGNAGPSPIWVHTNDYMRVAFAAQAFPMPEDAAALAAGVSASGGAFVGNYRATGAAFIGFDFYADLGNPGQLLLELVSGTNVYRRNLFDQLGTAGTTNRMIVPLSSRAAGGWSNPVGGSSDAGFESVLTNVTAVFIKLSRGPDAAHEYRVEQFFLVGQPLGSIQRQSSGEPRLAWDGLLPGSEYSLYATENLLLPASAWSNIITHAVSSSTWMWDESEEQLKRFYQLRME